jgi:hypothetical protein
LDCFGKTKQKKTGGFMVSGDGFIVSGGGFMVRGAGIDKFFWRERKRDERR